MECKLHSSLTLILIQRSLQSIMLSLLVLMTACVQISDLDTQTEEKGYYNSKTLWPSLDIPVCWEQQSAISVGDQQLVRRSVQDTWGAHVSFNFNGWGQCLSNSDGIRIGSTTNGAYVTGLGTNMRGVRDGMMLEFSPPDNECQGSEENRQPCVYMIAVHEFGHALGLAHEHNRTDQTSSSCSKHPQGTSGDVTVGDWDSESVMNYCNDNWIGQSRLSAGDIQTIQSAYAHLTNGSGQGATPATPSDSISPMNPADPYPPGQSSVGTGSCLRLIECSHQCNDQSCADQCVTESSPRARQAYSAIINCDAQYQCNGDFNCLSQSCYQDLASCDPSLVNQASLGANTNTEPEVMNTPSTSGSQSCLDILGCSNMCNTEECVQRCLAAATQHAQQAYYSLLECNLNWGCNGNGECITQLCYQELASCDPSLVTAPSNQSNGGQGQGPEPTSPQMNGELSCYEVLTCLDACNADVNCQAQCGDRASDTATEEYNMLAYCAEQMSCQDTECINTYCSFELGLCLG